jgi:signal transduction histidine kinase
VAEPARSRPALAVPDGAAEAVRTRRAAVAGVAHEMRTPLAQIRMFTEMLLLGRDRTEEERTAWLEAIDRQAHRLGEVTENLLLYLHGEEADPFPARRPTDLGAMVEDLAADFGARAATGRMRLALDPPAGVIAAVEPQAMRQALGNLIDNALRYGPPGQTVRLDVEASPAAPGALITVVDQGPGVPGVEPVPAGRPAPASPPGLGLAVARRVVEAHGGSLDVGAAPGGGARVTVFLPAPAERPAR